VFLSVYSLMWLMTTLIGVAGFPLLFIAFRWLPDRGYSIARYSSLILVAYISWLVAHLGVPFGTLLLWIVLGLFVCLNTLIGWRSRREIRHYFSIHWRYVLVVELLFLIGLGVFLWIVGYNAAIDPDSERMMDMAMLQGVINTTSFPQEDIWFSGHFVNYYYFGFVVVGILQMLSGIALPYFFNGAIAFVYALVLIGAYGVGYNFTLKHRYGFFAAFMVLMAGNLNAFVQFVSGIHFSALNWFGCARVIPGTINEFPWFSLLWGDLHPYMLAFPIVFIVFSFALNHLFRDSAEKEERSAGILQMVLWGILGGSLIAVNTWDYPSYFAVWVVAVFVRLLSNPVERKIKNLSKTIFYVIGLFLVGIFAYFPYLQAFRQHREINLVSVARSDFTDFFQLFGIFIVLFLVYGVLVIMRRCSASKRQGMRALICFFGISAVCLSGQTTYLYLLALTGVGVVALWLIGYREWRGDGLWSRASQLSFFVIAMAILPLLYAFICEFWYVNDLYSGLLERQNTVFKVYLQIWFICSIASVFMVYLINESLCSSGRHLAKWGFWILVGVMVVLASLYPLAGTMVRTGRFKGPWTLDGMAANRMLHPGDCVAIEWMNEHITGRPVILEAPGYAYCWNARYSTFTGLPGVLGWLNHEAGWRNSYEKGLARRDDMSTIYQTVNRAQAQQLMDEYNIEYVIIGLSERAKFPGYGLKKFSDMMDVVYNQSGVVIYRKRSL